MAVFSLRIRGLLAIQYVLPLSDEIMLMCGIVGYIGHGPAAEFLLDGLRRLEYRGYDSSGIATVEDGELDVAKTAGRVEELACLLKRRQHHGSIGIGHTRWATHGPATDENAHPHCDSDQVLALVHNGVIENFRAIKDRLDRQGLRVQVGNRHRSRCSIAGL